jgi:hypothetical protein
MSENMSGKQPQTPEQVVRDRINDIFDGATQRQNAHDAAWLRLEEELADGAPAQQQFLLDNLGRMMLARIEYDQIHPGIFDGLHPDGGR